MRRINSVYWKAVKEAFVGGRCVFRKSVRHKKSPEANWVVIFPVAAH